MPEIFQVLRCYKCFVFQIHQTKKSNKFECKMCGEKQSIKRHYGIGTGKDCRLHVQRLNSLRGEIEEKSLDLSEYNEDKLNDNETNKTSPGNDKNPISNSLKRSKWTDFAETEVDDAVTKNNESMFLGDKEVVLELTQKKIRKFKNKIKASYTNNIQENSSTSNNFSDTVLEYEWEDPNDIIKNPSGNFDKHLQDNKVDKAKQEHRKDIDKSNYCDKQKSLLSALKTSNSSSKWAQFVEDKNENSEPSNCELSEIVSIKDNLFNLCDDGDLDSVLDI